MKLCNHFIRFVAKWKRIMMYFDFILFNVFQNFKEEVRMMSTKKVIISYIYIYNTCTLNLTTFRS